MLMNTMDAGRAILRPVSGEDVRMVFIHAIVPNDEDHAQPPGGSVNWNDDVRIS
jgi:hypothetical protein